MSYSRANKLDENLNDDSLHWEERIKLVALKAGENEQKQTMCDIQMDIAPLTREVASLKNGKV